MIKGLLFLSILTALSGCHPEENEGNDFTINFYSESPPIPSLINQNPFLSLDQTPTKVINEGSSIQLAIPTAATKFVWKMNGVFEAKVAGDYFFSIGEVLMAGLQIGAMEVDPNSLADILEDNMYDLKNVPLKITLKRGHYPMRITHIAGSERVPVYVASDTGPTSDINEYIKQVSYDSFERSNEMSDVSNSEQLQGYDQNEGSMTGMNPEAEQKQRIARAVPIDDISDSDDSFKGLTAEEAIRTIDQIAESLTSISRSLDNSTNTQDIYDLILQLENEHNDMLDYEMVDENVVQADIHQIPADQVLTEETQTLKYEVILPQYATVTVEEGPQMHTAVVEDVRVEDPPTVVHQYVSHNHRLESINPENLYGFPEDGETYFETGFAPETSETEEHIYDEPSHLFRTPLETIFEKSGFETGESTDEKSFGEISTADNSFSDDSLETIANDSVLVPQERFQSGSDPLIQENLTNGDFAIITTDSDSLGDENKPGDDGNEAIIEDITDTILNFDQKEEHIGFFLHPARHNDTSFLQQEGDTSTTFHSIPELSTERPEIVNGVLEENGEAEGFSSMNAITDLDDDFDNATSKGKYSSSIPNHSQAKIYESDHISKNFNGESSDADSEGSVDTTYLSLPNSIGSRNSFKSIDTLKRDNVAKRSLGNEEDSVHKETTKSEESKQNIAISYTSGFAYAVYVAPRSQADYEISLKDQSGLELVSQGYFNEDYKPIEIQTENLSRIIEIIGTFVAPMDGVYRVSLRDEFISALQIGPGKNRKQSQYTIDNTWQIVDTRVKSDGDFHLVAGLVYPLRLVVLENRQKTEWEITVVDPLGEKTDLFGLYPPMAPMATSENDKIFEGQRSKELSLPDTGRNLSRAHNSSHLATERLVGVSSIRQNYSRVTPEKIERISNGSSNHSEQVNGPKSGSLNVSLEACASCSVCIEGMKCCPDMHQIKKVDGARLEFHGGSKKNIGDFTPKLRFRKSTDHSGIHENTSLQPCHSPGESYYVSGPDAERALDESTSSVSAKTDVFLNSPEKSVKETENRPELFYDLDQASHTEPQSYGSLGFGTAGEEANEAAVKQLPDSSEDILQIEMPESSKSSLKSPSGSKIFKHFAALTLNEHANIHERMGHSVSHNKSDYMTATYGDGTGSSEVSVWPFFGPLLLFFFL